MIGGRRVPAHVVALETTEAGDRYHGFLLIAQREAWIKQDPETRKAVWAEGPKVLEAWKTFSIVLHASEVRR